MLRTFLSQHPDVKIGKFFDGEIFNPLHTHFYKNKDPKWIMENYGWEPARATGFVLHLDRAGALLKVLKETPNVLYICLTRASHLDRYVSVEQAMIHKRWIVGEGERLPHLQKLSIKRKWFEKYIRDFEQSWKNFYEIVQPQLIHVTYEQLIEPARRDATLEKVFRFLGLEPVGVRPLTQKVSQISTIEQVANYGEIADLNTLYIQQEPVVAL